MDCRTVGNIALILMLILMNKILFEPSYDILLIVQNVHLFPTQEIKHSLLQRRFGGSDARVLTPSRVTNMLDKLGD